MLSFACNLQPHAFMRIIGSVKSPRKWSRCLCLMAVLLSADHTLASDHADPIDPFNKERLEGGITDLFAFPVDANDAPVAPHMLRDGISLAAPQVETRRMLST